MQLDNQHQSCLLSCSLHAFQTHSKTTSFLLPICLFLYFLYPQTENWGYFLIKKVIYSHLENSSNTENQTPCENHMTTENQLIAYVLTRVVNIFLVMCPTEGQSVDNQTIYYHPRRIFTQD